MSRFQRIVEYDIRTLIINVSLYENHWVPFVDFMGNQLSADQSSLPNWTRVMPARQGQYICMRAGNVISLFEEGEVPVTGGNWDIGTSTVIILQERGDPQCGECSLG